MGSIVRELQSSLLNPSSDILSILRTAHIIASKLELTEFDEWIQNELKGFRDNDINKFPNYRVVHGRLKAFNPMRGWIPIQCSNEELEETLCQKNIGISMPELLSLVKSIKEDDVGIHFSHKQSNRLCEMSDLGFLTECALHVNKSQFFGIIESVRNHLLEWTLELEKQGILGDDLVFSETETVTAQSVSPSINYYYGSVIQGNASNSQISSGDKTKFILSVDSVKEALNTIRNQVNNEKIEREDKEQIYEMISDIDEKIQKNKKPGVIRSALIGLKDFCIQVGANVTAALIIKQMTGV